MTTATRFTLLALGAFTWASTGCKSTPPSEVAASTGVPTPAPSASIESGDANRGSRGSTPFVATDAGLVAQPWSAAEREQRARDTLDLMKRVPENAPRY